MKILAMVICFLTLAAHPVHAQTHLIDSLKRELIHHPQKDTLRLNMLNDLSYYYSSIDPDKGIQIAEEAIALAKSLSSLKKLAAAYNNLGINYNTKGNDSLAIENYKIGMAIKKEIGDVKGIGVALHNIGIIYFNRADYESALDNQQRAFEIFKSIKFENGMAATMNSTGVVYLYLADYPRALDYYFRALKIYEHNHDDYDIANAFTNIGLVYDHSSQFKTALKYFIKAENIFKKKGRQFELQNVLTNMGNTFGNSGDPVKALEYYEQAKKINKTLGNQRGIASGLVNSAIAYLGMKDYKNSLANLEDALKLYQELDDKYGTANTLSYISQNYLNAPPNVLESYGIKPKNRLIKATEIQKQGLHLAIESGLLKEQSEAWKNLSNIYHAAKEDEMALEAFKNYIELRDSIMNDDKKTEITRLTMQFEFDKKQAAAKVSSDNRQVVVTNALEKQKIIKNVTATAAIIIIFAAGISFIFYERKRKATERARVAELKAEISDVEMKALRAQMNPHFIFNSLNSISDFIRRNDFESADHYLTKFSRLIRTILENSEYKEIPLDDDLEALDAYMQLESVRMNHKFTYEIRVDENVDQANTLIPPLILQPFVENSIWHGFAGRGGCGKILIKIKKEGEMIFCTIDDDGTGIKKGSENKKSLGMKITRSRIDLMNKLKKANATFDLVPLEEGTRVELKLPLILNY